VQRSGGNRESRLGGLSEMSSSAVFDSRQQCRVSGWKFQFEYRLQRHEVILEKNCLAVIFVTRNF